MKPDIRAREFLRDRVAAGPPGIALRAAPEAIRGARGDARAAIEARVPRFEIFAGILPRTSISDKIAGHNGATPPNAVHWDEAFDSTFGFEVQVNLVRPRRTAIELGAGDTFFGIRISMESYDGLASRDAPPPGAVSAWPAPFYDGTYDDMTLMGYWADFRTLLNPINAGRSARPYLHYGVGMVSYPEVLLTDSAGGASYPNWEESWALSWNFGIGLEFRFGNMLGLYVEAGVQAVGAPDVSGNHSIADPVVIEQYTYQRTAHDMVTYPIRIGLMVAF
jgi:hypothetical protein